MAGSFHIVVAKTDYYRWTPTLDKSDLEIPLASRESNFSREYFPLVYGKYESFSWIILIEIFLKKIYRRQLEEGGGGGGGESFATKIPHEIPARRGGEEESSEELNNTGE